MLQNPQSELREHLDAGEYLIWSGKPKSGVVFQVSDLFVIPFSILWCGFAIFWTFMAAKGSLLFALFGVPFVIVGLIFVFGRFIIDARQRANTIYGVTENRVLIKSGVFSKSIKSINIKNISDIELSEKSDGSGTITFGSKYPFGSFPSGMNWGSGVKTTPQLNMISNARKVYNQIIEIQNQ